MGVTSRLEVLAGVRIIAMTQKKDYSKKQGGKNYHEKQKKISQKNRKIISQKNRKQLFKNQTKKS